jgi:hypothetical protein
MRSGRKTPTVRGSFLGYHAQFEPLELRRMLSAAPVSSDTSVSAVPAAVAASSAITVPTTQTLGASTAAIAINDGLFAFGTASLAGSAMNCDCDVLTADSTLSAAGDPAVATYSLATGTPALGSGTFTQYAFSPESAQFLSPTSAALAVVPMVSSVSTTGGAISFGSGEADTAPTQTVASRTIVAALGTAPPAGYTGTTTFWSTGPAVASPVGTAFNGSYDNNVAQSTAVAVVPMSLIFSTANGNAISIADVGAGTQAVETTLSVSNGTLTLSGTAGLTFTAGANGTGSMTVTGSVAAIDKALDGLTYTPKLGYSGTDTLHVSFDNLGHGSSQDAFGIVDIVVPKNPGDTGPTSSLPAPVIALPGTSLPVTGGVPTTITGVSITNATLVDVVISVKHGTLEADADAGATVLGNGTSTIELIGTAADVDAALLTYTADAGYSGTDTLTVSAAALSKLPPAGSTTGGTLGTGGGGNVASPTITTTLSLTVSAAPTSVDERSLRKLEIDLPTGPNLPAPVTPPATGPIAPPNWAPVSPPVIAPSAQPGPTPVASPGASPVSGPIASPVSGPIGSTPIASPVSSPAVTPMNFASPIVVPTTQTVELSQDDVSTATIAWTVGFQNSSGVAMTPVSFSSNQPGVVQSGQAPLAAASAESARAIAAVTHLAAATTKDLAARGLNAESFDADSMAQFGKLIPWRGGDRLLAEGQAVADAPAEDAPAEIELATATSAAAPTTRGALLDAIATNFEVLDYALKAALEEIENLGGDLAVWLDESDSAAWIAAGTVVVLAGGGYYRQRRRAIQRSEENAETVFYWYFTHLHEPTGWL